MNQDANAILTLCSHLCVGERVQPLEPREYSDLAQRLTQAGMSPGDLFQLSIEDCGRLLQLEEAQLQRIFRLLDRSASPSFALGQYRNMGIETVTRADPGYPGMLKQKLGNSCPPIFYCAGDLQLLNRQYIGFVGARTVEQQDVDFTVQAVGKISARGLGVVSGGAKGIDSVAGTEALLRGGYCLEYLSDSMMKKLQKTDTVRNVQDGRLLLLSVAKPEGSFHVGMAMMRNRYIYAQSQATVVVRSDLNKGGTWTGAEENMKNHWCPCLCWSHPYPGNQALIQKGAIPVDESWDGSIPEQPTAPAQGECFEQISLFDGL